MRRWGVLVVAAAVGCGGGTTTTGGAREPRLDPAASRAAVEQLVREQYAAIDRLEVESWMRTVAPDAILLGTDPQDVWVGRDAAVAQLAEGFEPARQAGAKASHRSKNLQIGISPDGRAAWVADELDFTLEMGGQAVTTSFRLTQVIAERDGAWWVLAQHWSIGVPNETAFAIAARGKWPPLGELPARVAPGAEPLVARVQRGADDAMVWVNDISDREDVFVFGTAPEEVVMGGARTRELFGAQIRQYGVTIAPRGDVSAGLAPNGLVGWVFANLDFSVTFEGQTITQPYRSLTVHLNEGGAWRIVQAHFSNGVPNVGVPE